MRIVMITNTYLPHVGGVARSVERFTQAYRRMGHRVLVIAPRFENMLPFEEDVVRVHAIQNFNGSDFSVSLPAPLSLMEALDRFGPELIHSHHPYLLGDTALHISAARNLPLVFTYHTMYENYTHYVPADSPRLKRFVIELARRYANMCDCVIAPSESIAGILARRGVERPVRVIPTGVDVGQFAEGDGLTFRRELGIPENAFVVGHVGRLAPEKNLEFLARAVLRFVSEGSDRHFLVIGAGQSQKAVEDVFAEARLSDRLHMAGTLTGPKLIDSYHAMDVFAFASKTETQGVVLVEAMAAGVPVVALDAPGTREVVRDGENGRLLMDETLSSFASALSWASELSPQMLESVTKKARRNAESLSIDCCAQQTLDLYQELLKTRRPSTEYGGSGWSAFLRLLETEWNLWVNRVRAASEALSAVEHNKQRIPPDIER